MKRQRVQIAYVNFVTTNYRPRHVNLHVHLSDSIKMNLREMNVKQINFKI